MSEGPGPRMLDRGLCSWHGLGILLTWKPRRERIYFCKDSLFLISLDILLDLQVSYDYEPDNEVENIILLLEVLNFMYFKPNDFYKVD